ncbi:MAG: transposase family protein [Janthinobacterium lividum]
MSTCSMAKFFLNLPHSLPSHNTFRRVFSLVAPQRLEQCFSQWIATAAPPRPRGVVAVDGKTVRHSFDRGGLKTLYTWSVPSLPNQA